MKLQTLILCLLIALITIGILISADPPTSALGGFWFLNNDFVQINTTASGGVNKINVSEMYGNLGCGNITGSSSDLCTITPVSNLFLPYLIDLQTGNLDGGDINSILTPKDSDSFNISEVSGVPGLSVIINFTNVTSFDQIVIRQLYDGGSGHTIHIGLWDFINNEYEEEYGEISDNIKFLYTTANVYDSSTHISDTNVSLRLYHYDTGNTQHDFFIDYVYIGASSLSVTEHDGLSGRGNNNSHPQYLLYNNGSISITNKVIYNTTHNVCTFYNGTHFVISVNSTEVTC